MTATDQEAGMTSAQNPVPRDPPSPPGSELEALVDELGTAADLDRTESRAAPGAEPPDA